MSFNQQDKIKLNVKSSNYPATAKFASTLDETYILLVANNCNDYMYNETSNASIFGTFSTVMRVV